MCTCWAFDYCLHAPRAPRLRCMLWVSRLLRRRRRCGAEWRRSVAGRRRASGAWQRWPNCRGVAQGRLHTFVETAIIILHAGHNALIGDGVADGDAVGGAGAARRCQVGRRSAPPCSTTCRLFPRLPGRVAPRRRAQAPRGHFGSSNGMVRSTPVALVRLAFLHRKNTAPGCRTGAARSLICDMICDKV